LVEATAQALTPYFDRPFAFFGHSLGALVGFELARHLRRQGAARPVQLFASGRRAPQLPSLTPPRYNLPAPVLMDLLRSFEGTPPEILAQPEIMALLLPVFRADFEAHETYVYADEPPLDCPISAYGGTDDPEVSVEQLQSWQAQTTGAFSLQLFHGGHFFVSSQQWLVLRSLRGELEQLLGRLG
jgi:medium-chain acyl-[acyl-carrier-protein] hydrolase